MTDQPKHLEVERVKIGDWFREVGPRLSTHFYLPAEVEVIEIGFGKVRIRAAWGWTDTMPLDILLNRKRWHPIASKEAQ
jgi:hypothetical protein